MLEKMTFMGTCQAEAVRNSVKSSQIPLYVSDGKSVIGEFEISTSSVVKYSDVVTARKPIYMEFNLLGRSIKMSKKPLL